MWRDYQNILRERLEQMDIDNVDEDDSYDSELGDL